MRECRFGLRRWVGALVLGAVLAVSGCTQNPTGGQAFTCITSIGELPVFTLIGSENAYTASRPTAGGVTVLEIQVSLEAGGYDFVMWDVVGMGLLDAPDTMEFYFEYDESIIEWPNAEAPTLFINVYPWTEPGEYDLRVQGSAYVGSFMAGDEVQVGECYRAFQLAVQ